MRGDVSRRWLRSIGWPLGIGRLQKAVCCAAGDIADSVVLVVDAERQAAGGSAAILEDAPPRVIPRWEDLTDEATVDGAVFVGLGNVGGSSCCGRALLRGTRGWRLEASCRAGGTDPGVTRTRGRGLLRKARGVPKGVANITKDGRFRVKAAAVGARGSRLVTGQAVIDGDL